MKAERRGVALVLVLMATVISTILAYSFVTAQSTLQGVARNVENAAQARGVAESGLRLAVAYVNANSDWRSVRTSGTWVTNQTLGAGTFTVVGEDGEDLNGDGIITQPTEGDGDLVDDSSDLLTLTVTGTASGASHITRAVLTPVPGAGMIGRWNLDETSGLTASDGSGMGTDGTLVNTTDPAAWESGINGGGLHLDGDDDFIRVQDQDALDLTDSGTLSIWFKMDSFKNFAGLIHKGDASDFSDEAYTLKFWNNNKIYFGLVGDSSSKSMQTNTIFNNDQWYNVTATWDSSGMKIYVDGVLDVSNTTAMTAKNSAGNLNIGAQLPVDYNGSLGNLPLDGTIDEVRIYSEVLDATGVQSLYNLQEPAGVGSGATSVLLKRSSSTRNGTTRRSFQRRISSRAPASRGNSSTVTKLARTHSSGSTRLASAAGLESLPNSSSRVFSKAPCSTNEPPIGPLPKLSACRSRRWNSPTSNPASSRSKRA